MKTATEKAQIETLRNQTKSVWTNRVRSVTFHAGVKYTIECVSNRAGFEDLLFKGTGAEAARMFSDFLRMKYRDSLGHNPYIAIICGSDESEDICELR